MLDRKYIEAVFSDLVAIAAGQQEAFVLKSRGSMLMIEDFSDEGEHMVAGTVRYKDSTVVLVADFRDATVTVLFMHVGFGYPCYVEIDRDPWQSDGWGKSPLTFNMADPELFSKIVSRCDRAIVAVKRRLGIDQGAACNLLKWRRYAHKFLGASRDLEPQEWVEDVAEYSNA